MAKRDGMTTRRTKEEIEISRGGSIFEAFVVRIVSND